MNHLRFHITAFLIIILAANCYHCSRCSESGRQRAQEERLRNFRRIDVHAHIYPTVTEQALEFYRQFGVDGAVNVSGGYPGSGLAASAQASLNSMGRLHFMCNISWRMAIDDPSFVQRAIVALERCRETGGIAWKIPKILGLGAIYSDGRLVPVDAPELDPIFERAQQLDMPVLIHSADPIAFFEPPIPENERWEELQAHPNWSFFGPNFPSWEEVINQYERRIARHPNLRFIGAHFGNAPEEPRRVARMLDQYPNLFIDTAARITEIGRHNPQEMHDFFIRYQDRILFATDLGYSLDYFGRPRIVLGSAGREPPTERDIQLFWTSTFRYFETWDVGFSNPSPIQGRWPISGIGLPPEVLEKIYSKNAERVLGISLPPVEVKNDSAA